MPMSTEGTVFFIQEVERCVGQLEARKNTMDPVAEMRPYRTKGEEEKRTETDSVRRKPRST